MASLLSYSIIVSLIVTMDLIHIAKCANVTEATARQSLNPVMIPLTNHHLLLGFLPMSDEPLNHLKISPWSPDILNTKFFLYDKNTDSENGTELTYHEVKSYPDSKVTRYEKVFVIAHGFTESFTGVYVKLKDALLSYGDVEDVAVIAVDWKIGAMPAKTEEGYIPELESQIYGRAATNAMVVGREVALMTYILTRLKLVPRDKVHYIGHDLGAHVMHFAGEWYRHLEDRTQERTGGPRGMGKIGRITGLDPVARDFQGYGTVAKLPYLNSRDAEFVDIIHTSSVSYNGDDSDIEDNFYGMSILSGHVDFYPNGGQEQPFCAKIRKCSHRRALHYFIASLSNNANITEGLTAIRARSYKDFKPIKYGPGWVGSIWRKIKPPGNHMSNAMGIQATRPEASLEPRQGYFLDFAADGDGQYVQQRPSGRSNLKLSIKLLPPLLSDDYFDFLVFPSHDKRKIKQMETHALDRPGCGRFLAPPVDSARVRFGLQSYVRQFPWNVCLVGVKDEEGQLSLSAGCSGALIADDFVITAAHCFDRYTTESGKGYPQLRGDNWPMYLMFGIDCRHPVVYREVLVRQEVTVFIHPDYRMAAGAGRITDVALIKLATPIEANILPVDGQFSNATKLNTICWRNAFFFDYKDECETIYFAGHGYYDKINRGKAETLTWTVLNFAKPPPGFRPVETAQYSRNSESHQVREMCPGDSGGPFTHLVRGLDDTAQLFKEVSPYTAHLVGTLIGGTHSSCTDSDENTFLIANRVGHRYVYDWVDAILKVYQGPVTVKLRRPAIDVDIRTYMKNL
ncbi:Inactive pancreatic lipase-related protein 1 [Halotydeus destructor]|nr:Inactive pancreatic lipase-related protein 1 [Halotydeus destructor]